MAKRKLSSEKTKRMFLAALGIVFAAVFVYQLALLYRHEQGLDLNVGLKAFLKAA